MSILYAFFGQVRDRLLYLMTDPHERIVPPIIKWILTGCDINKDVTVSDKLQLTAINIQLKDADRVFRLYIKSLVSVIDGSNNTVIDTIQVGTSPYGIAYNPANQNIYVANLGSNNVSIIHP